MFAGENGGVSSVARTDFPEDSLRMDLDRRLADCEAAGNLFIGQTIAQAAQDLLLPLGQKIMKNPADTGSPCDRTFENSPRLNDAYALTA